MKLLITTFAVVAVMTLGASSAFAERGHSSHRGHSSYSGRTSHNTSRGHYDYNTHLDLRYAPRHGHYHAVPHTTRTYHATPYRSGYSSRGSSYYGSRYNSHSSGGFRYSGRNFSIGIGF